MMYDVIAIGEVLIDFTCVGQNEEKYPLLQAHPGGAPANFLAALSTYGCKTAFLGKVGQDSFGYLLANTLKNYGIDTTGLCFAPDIFTTLAFVTLDERGEREFSFARKPGADTSLRIEEIDPDMLNKTKVLHFGSLSLTHSPARETTVFVVEKAKEQGIMISYDPNFREALWENHEDARKQMLWGLRQADIVKISDEEVEFLFKLNPQEGAKKIVEEYGAKLVFVTCGSEGCHYSNGNVSGWVEGLKNLIVKDTTGAGDIFGGSVLSRIIKAEKDISSLTSRELKDMVSFACVAAGLSVTKEGGISSIMDEKIVEEYKKTMND